MATPKPNKRKKTIRTPRPELSAQEVRFCVLFTELKNATEAAKQAGFESTNRVALCTKASGLLRKPQIQATIRRMQREAADANQVTVNRLAQNFDHAAHADRTQIFDSKGRVKPPNKWPAELRSIITGFDVEEEETHTIDPQTQDISKVVTVKYKVRFRQGTEEAKILAKWRGMIDGESAKANTHAPLVIGGEADPAKL